MKESPLDLIYAFLDDTLTPDRYHAFENWLRESPAHQKTFLYHVHLNRCLVETHNACNTAERVLVDEGNVSHGSVLRIYPWRRWASVCTAAAAGLLIATGVFFFSSRQAAQTPYLVVRSITGDNVQAGAEMSATRRLLTAGSPVFAGEWVAAGSGHQVTLQYTGEDTTIVLRDGRARFYGAEDGAKRIDLEVAQLQARVAPQSKPLVIRTPHATATVLGTVLDLTVSDKTTQLQVETGVVKVVDNDLREVEVRGGYQVTAGAGMDLEPQKIQVFYSMPDPGDTEGVVLLSQADSLNPANWLQVISREEFIGTHGQTFTDEDLLRLDSLDVDGVVFPCIRIKPGDGQDLMLRLKVPGATDSRQKGIFEGVCFRPPEGIRTGRLVVDLVFYQMAEESLSPRPTINNRLFNSHNVLKKHEVPLRCQWNHLRYEVYVIYRGLWKSYARMRVLLNGRVMGVFETEEHRGIFPIQIGVSGETYIAGVTVRAFYGEEQSSKP